MGPRLDGLLLDVAPSTTPSPAPTPDTTPSDAVWTLTRRAGRVKHERVINERQLDPHFLVGLKALVRA